MKIPASCGVALAVLSLSACAGKNDPAEKPVRPGIVSRTLDTFRGSPDRIEEAGQPKTRGLAMSVTTIPETISLAVTRRLAVEITLANNSRDAVSLQFPTSQRIEIQILDDTGGVITRWSDDRAFAQMLGHVAINPGERVLYQETISLRDLKPDAAYTLEVLVPGHPDLAVRRTLRPKP